MNFEKLLGYDEPTTASRFNLLEVCPCMSPFVIAVLFILSSYVLSVYFYLSLNLYHSSFKRHGKYLSERKK